MDSIVPWLDKKELAGWAPGFILYTMIPPAFCSCWCDLSTRVMNQNQPFLPRVAFVWYFVTATRWVASANSQLLWKSIQPSRAWHWAHPYSSALPHCLPPAQSTAIKSLAWQGHTAENTHSVDNWLYFFSLLCSLLFVHALILYHFHCKGSQIKLSEVDHVTS